MMRLNPRNAAILTSSCEQLTSPSPELASLLFQNGAIELLVSVLFNHRSNAPLRDAVCRALSPLLCGPEERKRLCDAGGVDALLEGIAAEGAASESACAALWTGC